MAPVKRKSFTAINAQPQKKHKSALSVGADSSVLRKEEPVFPRGGASVLSPLEYKQIQIKATQDVLFEQGASQKSVKKPGEDDENESDELDDTRLPNATLPGLRRKRSVNKFSKEVRRSSKPAVRIEGLNYKVHASFSLVTFSDKLSSALSPDRWFLVKYLKSVDTRSLLLCPTILLVMCL